MSKGVSPLVASVMLIVIVVSMVAVISGWLTTMLTGTRETVTNRTQESVACSGASIAIDSIYVSANNTAGPATVIVRNDGIVDELSIVSAQIYNSTGHNFTYNTAPLPVGDFPSGSIKTLRFENVSLDGCGAFSQVVVATNCISAKFSQRPTNC